MTEERRGPGRPRKDAGPEIDDKTKRAAERRRARRERQPIGEFTQKLAAPPRPGFHRHWINDANSRVQSKYEDGYEFVADDAASDDEGSRISRIVGTNKDGSPMRAYLMEKPIEWYREDHDKPLDRTIAQTEEAIRRTGNIAQNAEGGDASQFYQPDKAGVVKTWRD